MTSGRRLGAGVDALCIESDGISGFKADLDTVTADS